MIKNETDCAFSSFYMVTAVEAVAMHISEKNNSHAFFQKRRGSNKDSSERKRGGGEGRVMKYNSPGKFNPPENSKKK